MSAARGGYGDVLSVSADRRVALVRWLASGDEVSVEPGDVSEVGR